jgi:hypothetical protein
MFLYGGQQGDRGNNRGSGRTARTTDELFPFDGYQVKDTFDTRKLCYFYEELNMSKVVVNNLPPPTIVRPPPSTTTPVVTKPVVTPPVVTKPVVTQPVVTKPVVTQPVVTQPPPDSRDERKKKRKEKDEEEHSHLGRVKDAFKSIFDADPVDPSQIPAGQTKPAEPSNFDKHVNMEAIDSAPTTHVAPQDRSELLKLRAQPEIKEDWLTNNGLDVIYAREQEREANALILKLNSIVGYVSPCALWNQVDKMEQLAASTEKFTATISTVVVNVQNTLNKAADEGKKAITDAKQAVVDVHARVKYSIGLTKLQNIKKVSSAVEQAIGYSVYPADYAGNPYRERDPTRIPTK